MSYILGIDLSQWQGVVDFNQVKAAGYQFAIPRMTYAYPSQGIKIDPYASKNYYGAIAAGMISGGYHKVGWTDPVAEADAFINAMSPLAEGDLLAHDMEPSSDVPIPANWSAWEQTYCQRILDRTHTPSIRYANISMNNSMPAQGVVTQSTSWVAAPSFSWDATVPVNVPVVIQQGATAHIPGIPANVCDTDAFFGTGTTQDLLNELKKIGYHAPSAPAPPPTPPVPAPPTPITTSPSTGQGSEQTPNEPTPPPPDFIPPRAPLPPLPTPPKPSTPVQKLSFWGTILAILRRIF